VLEAASEAWLFRALVRASPVMLDVKVVEPIVVSKVVDSPVWVETMGEVPVVSGASVAPGTPLTPEMVVSPVTVLVTSPLVKVEVQVLVVMALASPVSSASSPEPEPVEVLSASPVGVAGLPVELPSPGPYLGLLVRRTFD
jgi:hypothetical protein